MCKQVHKDYKILTQIKDILLINLILYFDFNQIKSTFIKKGWKEEF